MGNQTLTNEIVAQLDRASDCGSEGQKFESSRSRRTLVEQKAYRGFSLPFRSIVQPYVLII